MRASRSVLGAAVFVVLAACGGGGDGAAAPEEETATTAVEDTGTTSPTEGDATVAVATTSLGDVLVDAEGRTLYMFDPDKQGESTCYDQCAQAWPPLTVEGDPVGGEGIDDSLLGVVDRTDGSQQVTYGDWPLYYFAKDAAPGDVTGQGVNQVWWVIDAEGQPVR
jgi:predicted lipoprotein with Yx(FWY)xxD motif